MQKGEKEIHLKKLWKAVKSGRRNSAGGRCEAEATAGEATAAKAQVNASLAGFVQKPPASDDRRPSRSLLHPDHAKLMVQRPATTPPSERHFLSFDGPSRLPHNGGLVVSPLSSSAASSVTSMSGAPGLGSRASDPLHDCDSRRSSTLTNRYSLLDALDLEYALIKAAARGSVGPYSLSQSLQKLTFTQSLAFPALARGLSNKRNSSRKTARGPLEPLDSGVNAFAKVATVLVLVLISVLVFGVLYKFIRT